MTLNACLTTHQDEAAKDALAKRASMAAAMCTILRNGVEEQIDTLYFPVFSLWKLGAVCVMLEDTVPQTQLFS